MSRMDKYNSNDYQPKKKKSFGKRLLNFFLGLLLLLILAVGGMAAKVYFDAKNTVNGIQDTEMSREKSDMRETAVSTKQGDPISILLLGIDTGDLGRTEQGRSDTMMVATLNPTTKTSTLVSIPRDTYTEIIGRDTMDKLNHAYAFGGAEMSIKSMENLLQIPMDHYVAVNMAGLQEVVNAVGGIDVDNDLAFSQDGVDYPVGVIHLSGKEALGYIRMRYDDPNGDYGRQNRQRKVVTAIMKSALSLDTLTNYNDILKIIQGNVQTDLGWDELMSLQSKYRESFKNMNSDQLQGGEDLIGGISYQIIPETELQRVQALLKEQLDLN